MLADPQDGAINYFHGLAGHISRNIDGEQVDIVLCREKLEEVFLELPWDPEQHQL